LAASKAETEAEKKRVAVLSSELSLTKASLQETVKAKDDTIVTQKSEIDSLKLVERNLNARIQQESQSTNILTVNCDELQSKVREMGIEIGKLTTQRQELEQSLAKAV